MLRCNVRYATEWVGSPLDQHVPHVRMPGTLPQAGHTCIGFQTVTYIGCQQDKNLVWWTDCLHDLYIKRPRAK